MQKDVELSDICSEDFQVIEVPPLDFHLLSSSSCNFAGTSQPPAERRLTSSVTDLLSYASISLPLTNAASTCVPLVEQQAEPALNQAEPGPLQCEGVSTTAKS